MLLFIVAHHRKSIRSQHQHKGWDLHESSKHSRLGLMNVCECKYEELSFVATAIL